MKLSREKFQRMEDESTLELFRQGIKSAETRKKYTRTLKLILLQYLDEFLDGSFEERANQIDKEEKGNPPF